MVSFGDTPVIQAPMAGGPSTPELTAAVSVAGGYGILAAGYRSPEELRSSIDRTRALTDAPFGVNLFVPTPPADPAPVAAYARTLRGDAERLGVPLGAPRWDDDAFGAKVDLVAATRVHSVSFTFGCPDRPVVDRLHTAGCLVVVTVTSVDGAREAVLAGADALCVQGAEAGGHQGGRPGPVANHRTLVDLLTGIGRVTTLPMIGTGGIMDAADAAGVLRAGAVAVQCGTAFLCTPEAGTPPVHRAALLGHRFPGTIVTRAYSGRFARGLANGFAVAHDGDAPDAYPEVHHLTRPLRVAATRAGDPSVPNLWAGTGWARVTEEPAGDVVRRIAGGAGGDGTPP